jgi:hypothetical protein
LQRQRAEESHKRELESIIELNLAEKLALAH